MTIFYTIASAMLMSSNVSATNSIQRLPSVTVQAESSVSTKASKFFLKGKLLGIKKKTIIFSAVGIAAILAVVYIAKNSNKADKEVNNKELKESLTAFCSLVSKMEKQQDATQELIEGFKDKFEDKFKVIEAQNKLIKELLESKAKPPIHDET